MRLCHVDAGAGMRHGVVEDDGIGELRNRVVGEPKDYVVPETETEAAWVR
jgi:hypothetical protein